MTVREPLRGASDAVAGVDAVKAPPLKESLKLLSSNRTIVHLIVGLTLANTVAAGVSVWLPALLMRNHGATVQTAGLSIAFGVATFAALASFCSGMLADKVGARAPDGVPRMAALAALLTIPCIVYGALTSNYVVVIAAFAVKTVAHVLVNTPGYALTLSLAPPQIRGTTMAVLQVAGNLFSYGVGPQLIGSLSDALQPLAGTNSLRYSVAIFGCLNLWAMFHLLRAGHWLRHAHAAERSQTQKKGGGESALVTEPRGV
jgi:MFS family permease